MVHCAYGKLGMSMRDIARLGYAAWRRRALEVDEESTSTDRAFRDYWTPVKQGATDSEPQKVFCPNWRRPAYSGVLPLAFVKNFPACGFS